MLQLLVNKADLRDVRIVEAPDQPLPGGQARFRIDLFALTTNNISYAVMGGPPLGYWDFFPADDAWGKPPCWAFGTISQSNVAGVEVGARYYGYFPVADTLDVVPRDIRADAFSDAIAHRGGKAAGYNAYRNVKSDPGYDPAFEAEQTLLRPLYGTGCLAADLVRQLSPNSVLISSASSKTAVSLAHELRRWGGTKTTGLTSRRNAAYVRSTELYDEITTYDAIGSLTEKARAVYIDFLGRDDVTAAVHRQIGGALIKSLSIGFTGRTNRPGGVLPAPFELPGPKPEIFFSLAYRAQRLSSDPQLGDRLIHDMRSFYAASRKYMSIRKGVGDAAVLATWKLLAKGDSDPRDAHVLSF
jgi:hypothetical protein